MALSPNKTSSYPIRARSHLLRLIGDELIGDDSLAVFELVKNAYDADATEVRVVLDVARTNDAKIVVEDNGHGMTTADISGKWLVIATDAKRKRHLERTPKFHRLPLGEKGVGRFAAFKLGNVVTLTTRAYRSPEMKVEVNWPELISMGDYIEDLNVSVATRSEPKDFPGRATGTRVRISRLNKEEWSKGDIRRLFRLVTSLASPFESPDSFTVKFEVPGREQDIADMLKPNEFLEQAIWQFTFSVDKALMNWTYEFKPPHWKGLKSSKTSGMDTPVQLAEYRTGRNATEAPGPLLLTTAMMKGIGKVEGHIFAYYRRSEVLKVSGNQTQLKEWLDDQTGVRIFRDGIRVFNYGEPNDDWLGLDAMRINHPTDWLGSKSVVAAVHLSLAASRSLLEKTNREGFVQNDAYDRLHSLVLSVFDHFMRQHREDRMALDLVIKGKQPGERTPKVFESIERLKNLLKRHSDYPAIKRDLEAIEERFVEVQDVMVGAGMAGLNLAVIFHEVERSVDSLSASVSKTVDIPKLRQQIEHLRGLLTTFAPLLRKNSTKSVFASDLVKSAKTMREHRFAFHKIIFSAPILSKEEENFRLRVPANLIVSALGNLIDNAIYWSRYRYERDRTGKPPAVLVTTDWDEKDQSGFIAVVDNGPGFRISMEKAIEPFATERPGGMGLGLYFANIVMEQCGGSLTIHDTADFRDEANFSASLDGAAVVLRFGAQR